MVAHAHRAVPFYRSWLDRHGLVPGDFRSPSDLARLPPIDKNLYRKIPNQFAAALPQGNGGLELRTSGSTGQPAGVWHDRRALLLNAAFGTREQAVIRELAGPDGCRREVVFRQPRSGFLKVQDYYSRELIQPSGRGRNRRMASTERPPEENIELLNRIRPAVVSALGSYLGGLYRYAHRNRLKIFSPRVALYCGDALPESDRKLIRSEFGFPVVSVYRTGEFLKIGFTCGHDDAFHVHPDLCAVSLVDGEGRPVAPGQPGEVAVSNLLTRGTVLLHYRLGDRARWEEAPCPCGRTFPRLRLLEGRAVEAIDLPGGGLLDPYRILRAVVERQEVERFQVAHCGGTSFEVRLLVSGDAHAPSFCEDLSASLTRQLAGCRFHVRIAPELASPSRGKFQVFVPFRTGVSP